MPDAPDWITLKQAADRLGVHPTTLRRWADNGEIPVLVTPGGHRRFSINDIAQFAEERRRLRMVAGLEQIWAERAISQTRTEIANRRDEHWLAVFNEDERERKRLLGRKLMGLILQYVSLDHGGDAILDEACNIGREHAENARRLGMPLVEAIQAMLFFRDTLVEVAIQLPEVTHVRAESNSRLLKRINTLLNTVQLAIVETYDQTK